MSTKSYPGIKDAEADLCRNGAKRNPAPAAHLAEMELFGKLLEERFLNILNKPMSERTLGDYLTQQSKEHPNRLALCSRRRNLTYSELDAEVTRTAKALLKLGLDIGDRIAVLSSPRVEVMVTFLAAARLGLIWLGLNPKYRLREFEYVVDDARPRIIFGVDEVDGRSYRDDIQSLRRTSVSSFVGLDSDAFYDCDLVTFLTEGETVSDAVYDAHLARVDATLPTLMVYTSGSSGKPKGVLLSHKCLVQRCSNHFDTFPVSTFPKIVNAFPINHIAGMQLVSLNAFLGKGTQYYIDRFDPDQIIDLLKDGTINTWIVVPTMLHLLSVNPRFEPQLLETLDWLLFSGAAMPKELMQMLFRLNLDIGLGYGMTETGGFVTCCKADRKANNIEQMTTCIGRPMPENEVRVVRPDGDICKPGDSGEIHVRAAFCMTGYFGREDATQEVFTSDGWMKTGDLATVRDDGMFEFTGRMSEMFKSGGYNVYPREIELALETHPDVALAAVVPRKDPVFNEVGIAYVIPKEGASLTPHDLEQWARNLLANYKVPKRIILSSDLPLLPVGKVDKIKLKELVNSDAPEQVV